MPIAKSINIQLAQDWALQLDHWIQGHGLGGYDPFDIKGHPLIRILQSHALPRKTSSVLLDLFPIASRRLLHIPYTHNPKAYALTALGRLRLYQMTGSQPFLDDALTCLNWLRSHPSGMGPGLSWGYPFDVSGKGVHRPIGTPIGVVTAIAGEAFTLAWSITNDPSYRDTVMAIAQFIINGLNRIERPDGLFCFSYSPADHWPVHNANLHAIAHLFRTTTVTGDTTFRETARPALQFTLERQQPRGEWLYGEWEPGAGHEKSLLHTVDHHHTGFVLRSLDEIDTLEPSPAIQDAIVRGYHFYEKHLFTPSGAPRITPHNLYPINIHACAEGILCPAVLAHRIASGLTLATRTLQWTHQHMADPHTGLPYYRRYPWFTNRLIAPRWNIGWIFYALSEYLWRAHHT